jgi:hypothetical protein
MEARDISTSHAQPFEISLRIRHPSIDPEQISRELKVEPEHSFKAGEPRESGSGNVLTATHSETYWLGSLSTLTGSMLLAGLERARFARERMQATTQSSLTQALDASVVAFLRSHADFIHRLQSEDGQVSLLVELSTNSLTGFSLSPQFNRALSDLGVAVEFEFVAS